MEKITFIIDGKTAHAEPGRTILEAALDNGVYIPHLCGHESLAPAGACGMCGVKVKGIDGVTMACSTKVAEGMDIDTRDDMAEKIRKLSCDFIFKTHPSECTGCPKYGKCQLQTISQYVGDTGRKLRENKLLISAIDTNPVILHEMHRCILCGRCVRVCTDVRGVGAIRFEKVKERMRVIVDGDSLTDAGCRFCTACVDVCPTGSIREHEAIAAKMEGKTRDAALVPCRDACPAHIDIPRYVRYISEGDPIAAAAVVREKAPFPHVLGYICTHPCETECKRGFVNEPVSIRNLKRYAAQAETEARNPGYGTLSDGSCRSARETDSGQTVHVAARCECADSERAKATGKKVAIIGAGPTGLTAAFNLARKGHDVTVFDENERAGGMLRYGVPKYRLPRDVLDVEISDILSAGVTLETGSRIGSAPELLKKGFDAVLAAVGAHRGARLPLPGADLGGVYINTGFLRDAETGAAPRLDGLRVMVLGGGNVALDCAGVARRLGASEVHVACLEAYDKMTSTEEELAWALEEGIVLHNSRTFLEITGDDGQVSGMTLAAVSDFHFDENGKSVICIVPNSEEMIPVEAVIFAIGQRPDIDDGFGVGLGPGGRIGTANDCATSVPGVFAAGDCVTGTISVISAIAGARSAASMIDIYLGGDGVIDAPTSAAPQKSPYIGKIDGFGRLERNEGKIVPPAERSRCFEEMDLGFDGKQASCESERCLRCDLRLDIAPQRFWTDYAAAATEH